MVHIKKIFKKKKKPVSTVTEKNTGEETGQSQARVITINSC